MRQRPNEYAGLAFCAAVIGVVLAALAVYPAAPGAWNAWGVVFRGAGVLLSALALVTAEAIWRVRPWAYRAGAALAWSTIGCFVVPALAGLLMGELLGAFGMLLAAGFIAFPVLPMVGYLRRMHPQLHPRPQP
ncbi:hypothetical protein [Longimicrobium sp.]|uniref:hypothetical protein n=1 Tax=Longimicrobium sp. TaxID=2029185 RepID=UPI002C1D3B44|nr:hypothetical protein [Longimicrobium sp.]HSU13868.1 hypothetical protein [Longimicrobium sp.]